MELNLNKKAVSPVVVVMLLVAVAVTSVSGYAIWTRSYQAQIQDSVQDSGNLTDSIKHYLCVMECEARFDSPGKEGCIVECYNEEHTPDIGEFALQFDGNKTHVEIPASNNLNINGSEITVEAWVRWDIDPTTGNPHANIVSKVSNIGNPGPHYMLQHNSDNTLFEFSIGTSTSGFVWSDTRPEKDIWYHVVGTYDGSNIRIYVNGKLENSKPHSGNFSGSENPLYFGISAHQSYNRNFNGTIDRVLIYSRALSDQEILASYNRQHVNSEGLEGKWLFEEGGGETVFDSSGNGNDGTIHGAERS